MKCPMCKGRGAIENQGFASDGHEENCPACGGTGEVNSEGGAVIHEKRSPTDDSEGTKIPHSRKPCRLCRGLGTMQGPIYTYEGRDEPCPVCHGAGLTD